MEKVIFMLDEETRAEVADAKRTLFYDKSWSDLYRYLIKLGLQESKHVADALAKEE